MGERKTIREPGKDIPVYAECDVLVSGGGPAGCAAAASAARHGAETILLERYGYLGGMSTGGLVIWIDRMTDWSGRQVITGFADDLLGRVPKEGMVGPPKETWGSKDPDLNQHWRSHAASHHDTVTWSPTIDPEMLKNASFEVTTEHRAKLILHSWAVAPVQEGNALRGVIFESKGGRRAILAKVVIDATGDGDIFAQAGESFETDIFEESDHHTMNVAFLFGGVDQDRYMRFKEERNEEWNAVMATAGEMGLRGIPLPTPIEGIFVFMGAKLSGYSSVDVKDLTAVEIESRRRMKTLLYFYRANLPGFEKAQILLTAPQIGVRHSRRLDGVGRMTFEDWSSGKKQSDEIGVSPPPTPQHPNVSIPLSCMIPRNLDNLLAAGRNLSCDARTHDFMREIPNCWVLGQAAGVAAAVAVDSDVKVRKVNVGEVRKQLLGQGVYLQE